MSCENSKPTSSERWDMVVRNAYRLIEDAEAAQKLDKFVGNSPIRQSHMTVLRKLETDEQRAVGYGCPHRRSID